MATIRYTHGFSLLHQIIFGWGVILFGGFGLTAAVISIIEPAWLSVAKLLPENVRGLIEVIACLAAWAGSVYLIFKAIIIPLSPLPTWLYLRLSLFVPATWQDAKDTSFLFDGDVSGQWYPFTALRKVPREYRREVLHEFANKVYFERFGIPNTQNDQNRRDSSSSDPGRPKRNELNREDEKIENARKVLGVPMEASADDIKKSYRQLIKKYHPDIYANSRPELQHFAHEKTKELNDAYDVLGRIKNGKFDNL